VALTNYRNFNENSQVGFNLLPAVALGGPPHSGKSVLAYSLTRALRERGIPHYLLRAYPPDYEGDWFLTSEPQDVRHLRIKGASSEAWLPRLRRDLAHRHLPLLVDLGGLPTLEQETLLDDCTHAVLLTPDAESHEIWAQRMRRHGLILLGDLHSDLPGLNHLETTEPLVHGTLAGLERGRQAEGPAFEALIERLAQLFTDLPFDLYRWHMAQAPAELTVDLDKLAQHFGADPRAWHPAELPRILDYLPEQQPLAVYGRGPNWLYAALARHAVPAPFYLFNTAWGWLTVPELADPTAASAVCTTTLTLLPQGTLLHYQLPEVYIDLEETLPLPAPPKVQGGLIISGKLPLWLYAALARSAQADWIAVRQPQLKGAVVIVGKDPTPGTLIPLE